MNCSRRSVDEKTALLRPVQIRRQILRFFYTARRSVYIIKFLHQRNFHFQSVSRDNLTHFLRYALALFMTRRMESHRAVGNIIFHRRKQRRTILLHYNLILPLHELI